MKGGLRKPKDRTAALTEQEIDAMVESLLSPAIFAIKRRVRQIIEECARQPRELSKEA